MADKSVKEIIAEHMEAMSKFDVSFYIRGYQMREAEMERINEALFGNGASGNDNAIVSHILELKRWKAMHNAEAAYPCMEGCKNEGPPCDVCRRNPFHYDMFRTE